MEAMSAFRTILLYSSFILAAPITTFFLSKYYFFDGIIGASVVTSNVWSAVFAVVVLHVGLGLYIYRAYTEAEKVKPLEKTD
ncbi:hypothetical protein NQ315_002098 [Exocentrus adspersus]|uniref:Vacuolar ATPase assembly integral membrane protein VMA21 homolog n=1 Tax=Exocentrus adspersus TaxID=1586481 RepID=A0AAV8W004_9CUCU|nr:hypothetical protein NQ315_002098 [Exocentrus adspersus]